MRGRGGDGKRLKYHLVGTRSLEARDHLHRSGLWSTGTPKQRVRASPNVVFSSARARVVKLEAALAALGDASGPEVAMLQSSLQSAKRAQEPALDVQVSQREQFVSRAQKRLVAHDEERARLVSEL